MRLKGVNLTWGFGLCFLYLRNVKGFEWNHRRVCRMYRELERTCGSGLTSGYRQAKRVLVAIETRPTDFM